MARPKAFDPQEATGKALEVLWTRGYEATSVDDLCSATGLSRSSLYETYGSKEGVLLAALDQYQDWGVRRIAALLDRVRPIDLGLEAFFVDFVDAAVAGPGRRGCFIGNCAAELGARVPPVATRLKRGLQGVESVIHAALEKALDDGEIASDTDIRAVARFMMATAQGLRIVAKANPDRALLMDIVRTALSVLR